MNSVCELCSKPIYSGDGSYGACNECVKIHISNAIKDKKSYESIHLRHSIADEEVMMDWKTDGKGNLIPRF